MTHMEKHEVFDRTKAADADEQRIMVRAIDDEILFDELKRRNDIMRGRLRAIQADLAI